MPASSAPAVHENASVSTAHDITARELAWVLSGFAVVTLLFLAPLVGAVTTSMPANAADARLNAWTLAWGADRLPHALRGFWSPPIYYPYPDSLAYIENMLGIAILVAPVHWLSGNPILTYNAALLLSFFLAATGAYLLAREVTGRRDAALVGACAFGFAPYRWAQLPHLQVLFVGWLAVAVWALHRALRTKSWPMVAIAALAVPIQALSNGYAAYQAAVAIPLVVGWAAVKDRAARPMVLRMAAAAIVIALLLTPAAMAYYRTWSHRTLPAGDLERYSADLGNYLDVAPGLPLAGWLPGIAQDEGRLFPGLAVALLAGLALSPLPRRRPASSWRWLYGTIALVAIVLSLGPDPRAWHHHLPIGGLYRWLLDAVPLFAALRVPARFGMLAILAFSVLAAIGTARLTAGLQSHRAALLTASICGVILIEGYGGPLNVQRQNLTGAPGGGDEYVWLAQQAPGPVLHLPLSRLDRTSAALQHQFAVLAHRHPTVNGVSRMNPPLPTFLVGSASPFVDPAGLSEAVPFLRGLGVRYLLVRPDDFEDRGIAARLVEALGRADQIRLAARFRTTLAYEISPERSPANGRTDLVKLSPEDFRLTASDAADRVNLVVDGDPESRWMTGRPQSGTEWMALTFDRPRAPARVDFSVTTRSLQDYPRQIEIAAGGSAPGESEQILYRGSVLEALGRGWVRSPAMPIVSIDLPRFVTTRLVIRQLGTTTSWYWSIDEMAVWAYR